MGILTRLRNAFGRSRKSRTAEAEGAAPTTQAPAEPTTPEAAAPRVPSPSPEPGPAPTATVPEPRDEHDLVSLAFDNVTVPRPTRSGEEPSSTTPEPVKEPSSTTPEPVKEPEPATEREPEPIEEPVAAERETEPVGEAVAAEREVAEEPKAAEADPAGEQAAAKPDITVEPAPAEPVAAEDPVVAEKAEATVTEAQPEPAEAQPEPAEAVAPEADTAEQAEPKAEPQAKAPESETEAEAEPGAENPKAEPQAATTDTQPEPEAEAETEPQAEAEPQAEKAAEPEPAAEAEQAPAPAPAPTPEAAPASAEDDTPAPEPAAADGDEAPQGPPAADDESRTGGAGGNDTAEGEAEAERDAEGDTEPQPALTLAQLKSRAPGLATAYRAAATTLKTHDLTGTRAKVYLVLDRSASMRPYYKDGSAQALAEQTLALAAHLDPEATVPVVFFSTELDGTGEITLTDHENKIDTLHASLGRMGRTSYHAAVEAVLAHHDKVSTSPPGTPGTRGTPGTPGTPALVVFQTDGAPDAKTPATQALTEAAKTHPAVFFSFVAFGDPENKAFDYLRKLKTPNTSHFLAGETPRELTDKELYEGVLANWRP
ncbi:VWA domain-containing protein [Streptomyces sp. NPDC057838]|uniref:VWA domain-containing protein n=1 Tax=unclassified Streptomyces TaxID=2593676 RepID=UPI0036B612D7